MTMPEQFWVRMWQAAESDYKRSHLAWLSARQRAANSRAANRALGNENGDLHHRLQAEQGRVRYLETRLLEAERALAEARRISVRKWG